MSRTSLNTRRVWVTGASTGIGRAVTLELVRRGATVFASARNESVLNELVRECGGDHVTALPFDVTDRAANQRAVNDMHRRAGAWTLPFSTPAPASMWMWRHSTARCSSGRSAPTS